MDDVLFYATAVALLECARAGLEETSYGAPARAYVAVGEAAHDDCCDGQLTVAMVRRYPSAAFPDPDVRPIICNSAFTAMDFAIEIVRCAPTQDDLGRAPSVEALNLSALQSGIEARAVWQSVLCCARARDGWEAVVVEQVDIVPQGGCVGSRMTVTIGVVDGCACP